MKLRDARPEDATDLADIVNHYIRHTSVSFNEVEKTPEIIIQDVARRQASGYAYLVAEDSGRILGFATYSQFRMGSGYRRTMEHTLLLDPEARRKGTGRALLQALEAHARAAGTHSLIAGISAENTEALAFHRKMGFDHEVTLPETGHKFGRWIDLILLQKRLLSGADSG